MGPSSFAPVPNVVPKHWRHYPFNAAQSHDHAIADAAVVSQLHVAADDDPTEVIDDEVATAQKPWAAQFPS
jgi:hypothetical protein